MEYSHAHDLRYLLALAFSIPPSIWTLMSFNFIVGNCLGLKSQRQAFTSSQSFAAGGCHGPHDGIPERLRVQFDL
jgi:hypothetical protein